MCWQACSRPSSTALSRSRRNASGTPPREAQRVHEEARRDLGVADPHRTPAFSCGEEGTIRPRWRPCTFLMRRANPTDSEPPVGTRRG